MCKKFASILLRGVVFQCDVLIECVTSITNAIIINVKEMKAINLNKGRSIFLPVILM